jgi:acyl-CoA synthetase (AMP-forming)/AMP-acid ligase II
VTTDLVDLLRRRAAERPDDTAYVFREDGERETGRLTHAELDRRARAIAARLAGHAGARALLLFPPGLDYIAAFFGCLYARVIAVPAYPPDPTRLARTLPRLRAIVADADVTFVLTTSAIVGLAGAVSATAPELARPTWLATDAIPAADDCAAPAAIDPFAIAFLQYTSGSTGAPKGVALSHRNLVANLERIGQAFRVGPGFTAVIWLPPYHDMGLIGGILHPLHGGYGCELMPPMAFLQRPARWLRAIARQDCAVSGGPNFAFELCARKVTDDELADLRLDRWRVAFSGAEPVRAGTLARFADRFAPAGFDAAAFYPCYGLAEATLIVAGAKTRAGGPTVRAVDRADLERGRLVASAAPGATELVSSGAPVEEVAIVDPATARVLEAGAVGEIWVRGPNVATGYFGGREPETFAGAGDYLRTGDLGALVDGELYVTGRMKDLIIVRGRNLYPQDLEACAETAHPALRPGCAAAFALDGAAEERLAIVVEVDPRRAGPDVAVAAADAVRRALAEQHDVAVDRVVVAAAGAVPKTSSGKIQRRACRQALLDGTLETVLDAATPDAPLGDDADVRAWLDGWLAARTGARAGSVDLGQPATAFGVDSLAALELAAELESRFQLSVDVAALLGGRSLATLLAEARPAAAAPAVGPAAGAYVPLTPGQQAMWAEQLRAPGSTALTIARLGRLAGALDEDALAAAIVDLGIRHPPLGARISVEDGAPSWRTDGPLALEVIDVPAGRASARAAAASLWTTPFDLGREPPARFRLIRSGAERWLAAAFHHVVVDGWSLPLLRRELAARYAERTSGRPPRPVAPAPGWTDLAARDAAYLASSDGEIAAAHWRAELAGDLPILDLGDEDPPAGEHRPGLRVPLEVPAAVCARLRALARAEGTTLSATLLAGYAALLARHAGQDGVVVGCAASVRDQAAADLCAYLVNPLPIRVEVAAQSSLRSVVRGVRTRLIGGLVHRRYPFPLMVAHAARRRARSRTFQTVFAMQPADAKRPPGFSPLAVGHPGHVPLGPLRLELDAAPAVDAQVDVALYLDDDGTVVSGTLEVDTRLVDATRAEALAERYVRLLAAAAADPDLELGRVPLAGAAERARLGAARALPAAAPTTLHGGFARQAALRPDEVAVVGGGQRLSYRELDERANGLAHELAARGVGRGSVVGLHGRPVVGARRRHPRHPQGRRRLPAHRSRHARRAHRLHARGRRRARHRRRRPHGRAYAGRDDRRHRRRPDRHGPAARRGHARRPRLRHLHLRLDGPSEGRAARAWSGRAPLRRHGADHALRRQRCLGTVPLRLVRRLGVGAVERAPPRRSPRRPVVAREPRRRRAVPPAGRRAGHLPEPDADGVPPAHGRRGARGPEPGAGAAPGHPRRRARRLPGAAPLVPAPRRGPAGPDERLRPHRGGGLCDLQAHHPQRRRAGPLPLDRSRRPRRRRLHPRRRAGPRARRRRRGARPRRAGRRARLPEPA